MLVGQPFLISFCILSTSSRISFLLGESFGKPKYSSLYLSQTSCVKSSELSLTFFINIFIYWLAFSAYPLSVEKTLLFKYLFISSAEHIFIPSYSTSSFKWELTYKSTKFSSNFKYAIEDLSSITLAETFPASTSCNVLFLLSNLTFEIPMYFIAISSKVNWETFLISRSGKRSDI